MPMNFLICYLICKNEAIWNCGVVKHHSVLEHCKWIFKKETWSILLEYKITYSLKYFRHNLSTISVGQFYSFEIKQMKFNKSFYLFPTYLFCLQKVFLCKPIISKEWIKNSLKKRIIPPLYQVIKSITPEIIWLNSHLLSYPILHFAEWNLINLSPELNFIVSWTVKLHCMLIKAGVLSLLDTFPSLP